MFKGCYISHSIYGGILFLDPLLLSTGYIAANNEIRNCHKTHLTDLTIYYISVLSKNRTLSTPTYLLSKWLIYCTTLIFKAIAKLHCSYIETT